MRLFAVEQFHHFASMAIGVAMLGFGASGTLVALLRRPPESLTRWSSGAAVATGLLLTAAPLAADALALDATQLATDLREWRTLALLETVLALPFAASALAILLAVTAEADRPGRLYGASFLGAGAGALSAVGALHVLDPLHAMGAPGLLAALGGLALARSWRTVAGAATSAVLAGICIAVPPWALDMTPYKALPQAEAYPDFRRLEERTGPLGWVVAARAPAFRHAPGLALSYRGEFPEQTGLFVDGEIAGALTSWSSESGAALVDWLPASIPFAAAPRERVAVIGAGEGTEVAAALRHGSRHVTAFELSADLAALQQQAPTPPAWDAPARVVWRIGDARSRLAQSSETFDLVTLGPAGGFGISSAGTRSLHEDYLHTEEAYVLYLRRLRPGGVLAITRWQDLPPRESVRVVLTAARALDRVAPGTVPRGLVVVRSWGTATTLVKPDGFSADELAALGAWCATRRFDVDWRPGLEEPPSQPLNRLPDPALFRAASAAAQGGTAVSAFTASYPFRIDAVSDARPYPHHFLDVGRAYRLLTTTRGAWLPFAEWGFLALVATLIQATIVAAVFILAPTLLRAAVPRPGFVPILVYFGAIGLAYLAAEIAAIAQLGLLLGHPVYAVVAVLVVMLAGSGAGSVWSDRREPTAAARVAFALPVVLGAYAAALLAIVHLVHAWPLPARVFVAVLVLAPLAFLMGMPFPIGLRALGGGDPTRVAWAWALNGFASVVSAPLSSLLALEAGTPALFAAAAAAYMLAGLAVRNARLLQSK